MHGIKVDRVAIKLEKNMKEEEKEEKKKCQHFGSRKRSRKEKWKSWVCVVCGDLRWGKQEMDRCLRPLYREREQEVGVRDVRRRCGGRRGIHAGMVSKRTPSVQSHYSLQN